MTGYNSKMVHNRCIVSVKAEWEVVCGLSIGYVANDLGWTLTIRITLFYTFGIVCVLL